MSDEQETEPITIPVGVPFKVGGFTGEFITYSAFGELSIIRYWPNGAARVLTDNQPGRLHFGSVEETQAYLRSISPYRKGK